MASNYDDVLDSLVNQANTIANTGTQKEQTAFANALSDMARNGPPQSDARQAAMQIRLANEATVSRNAQGNLSFSAAKPSKNGLSKRAQQAFGAKATVVDDTDTVVIGEGNDIAVMNPMGPSARELDVMGQAASSRSLRAITTQLTAINKIQDPYDRARALTDMSTQINQFSSARTLELQQQALQQYKVPQLQAELERQRALDRQSPQYQIEQTDSNETLQVQRQLTQARQLAYTQAQRTQETDSVLATLNGELTRTQNLIKIDQQENTANKGTQQQRDRAATWFNMASDTKQNVLAAYRAVHSSDPKDDQQLQEFYFTNGLGQKAANMDAIDFIASAGNPMTSEMEKKEYGKYMQQKGISDFGKIVNIYGALTTVANKVQLRKGQLQLDNLSPDEQRVLQNPQVRASIASIKAMDAGMSKQGLNKLSSTQKAAIQKQQSRMLAELAARTQGQQQINKAKLTPLSDANISVDDPALQNVINVAASKGATINDLLSSSDYLSQLSGDSKEANSRRAKELASAIDTAIKRRVTASIPGIDPTQDQLATLQQQASLQLNHLPLGDVLLFSY